ncbi:hypothetical protein GUJ93_ZPchr0003g17095 [Zizania palustris]|uniref:Uncharacterized protein n=1 Tax=Zizania palustris TaxID=103762 RepID=A0A8J5S9S5_ZIZPA|nr:hypothetical protein GUJ93_ZPchr0003g17095 [Zizania palustris]
MTMRVLAGKTKCSDENNAAARSSERWRSRLHVRVRRPYVASSTPASPSPGLHGGACCPSRRRSLPRPNPVDHELVAAGSGSGEVVPPDSRR